MQRDKENELQRESTNKATVHFWRLLYLMSKKFRLQDRFYFDNKIIRASLCDENVRLLVWYGFTLRQIPNLFIEILVLSICAFYKFLN